MGTESGNGENTEPARNPESQGMGWEKLLEK